MIAHVTAGPGSWRVFMHPKGRPPSGGWGRKKSEKKKGLSASIEDSVSSVLQFPRPGYSMAGINSSEIAYSFSPTPPTIPSHP